MISQAAPPAAAPALADRATVATASAKAQTAVIGISQLNVTVAAVPPPGPDTETTQTTDAAMAGGSSATPGGPLPVVAATPAASTTMLVSSQGSSRDGVVSRARARP